MTDEVLFDVRGRVGWVTLNRPTALNALTHGMACAMAARLRDWAADDAIVAVAIEGAGERAFCAGGDIRVLYDAMRRGDRALTRAYYWDEYRLNRQIATYPKPYVALVDGVVMGGGVGVAVHGRYRVVGDRVTFAMPETGIGLFPDVGATFFLPRMRGEVGTYLGLTGARLGAADALYAGFATHAVPSTRWSDLTRDLAYVTSTADIPALLAGLVADPSPPPLAAHRAAIDRCFAGDSIAEVLEALEHLAGGAVHLALPPTPSRKGRGSSELNVAPPLPLREGVGGRGEASRLIDESLRAWSAETLATLRAKAPTSLAVTLRQLRLGRTLDLDAGIRAEFRLSQRFVADWDFPEGIRAVIIDKDNRPAWRPAHLDEVTAARLDAYFAPLPGGDLTYDEDPHG